MHLCWLTVNTSQEETLLCISMKHFWSSSVVLEWHWCRQGTGGVIAFRKWVAPKRWCKVSPVQTSLNPSLLLLHCYCKQPFFNQYLLQNPAAAPVPDSGAEHRKSRGPYFHQTNPQSSTNSALLPLSETVDALFSAKNLAVQGDMLLQLHQLKEHLKEKLEFLFNWV